MMARKPICPADMGKSVLPMSARVLTCLVSNAVLDHYKTYTAFCDALRGSPARPCWVFENKPPSAKARGQERTECGKYLGVGARKIPNWELLAWVARQITPEEDLDARLDEWAREWTAATGKALPGRPAVSVDPLVDELKTRVQALSEERDKAAEARDLALRERDVQSQIARRLQARLDKTEADATALAEARQRDRAQFDAEQRRMHDELSRQRDETHALTARTGACRQNTALLLAFLASVDSTVKADLALTSFGLRSDVTATVSTRLPPALAALLDLDLDSEANRSTRRFAIYVHALLLGDGGRPLVLTHVAARTGICAPVLAAILNGQCLPTRAQLRDIVAYCPDVGVHGPRLLSDALAAEPAALLTAPQRAQAATRHHLGPSQSVRLTIQPAAAVPEQREPASDSPSRRFTRVPRPRPAQPEPVLFAGGPLRQTPPRRWGWLRPRTLLAALVITVLAAVPLVWIAGSVGSGLSLGQGILAGTGLAVLGGDPPTTLRTESGEIAGIAWAGLSHGTPQASTFQPVHGTMPYRGLKGAMWLQHPDGCTPSVAVRVRAANTSETLSLLQDNVIDLSTDIDVEPSWNNRFRVELTRLDVDSCPVSVLWSGAGTR